VSKNEGIVREQEDAEGDDDKAAIVAPDILERANRGQTFRDFNAQRPKTQRPRLTRRSATVENPNTEHRTRMVILRSHHVLRPAQLFARFRRNSDQFFGFSQACDQTRIRFIFLSRDTSHDGRMSMFRI